MGVCFVDTETTALHPWAGEIWEVGLILPDGDERQWFLEPAHLETADQFSLDIGGYHRRHPHGLDMSAAASQFRGDEVTNTGEFCLEFAALTFRHHIAAACVSFDDRRLSDLLMAHHEVWQPWHYHVCDTEALAAGWLMGRAAREPDERAAENWRRIASPPWDSTELSVALGVIPSDFERHTALGDCRWAKAIYEAVMTATSPPRPEDSATLTTPSGGVTDPAVVGTAAARS